MLRSGEGTLVNGNSAPASIAIFSNDQVQTPKTVGSRIEMTGSSADVTPETVLQYQSDELVLDHGSLSVSTSRGLRVRVGCITITPVHDNVWTRYDVKDVNGRVDVSALKDDVYIDEHAKNFQDVKQRERNRSTVHETEQKSREEKCAGGYYKPGAEVDGIGGIMNSWYAITAGSLIVAGITCYALCRSGEPASPTCPSKQCSIP